MAHTETPNLLEFLRHAAEARPSEAESHVAGMTVDGLTPEAYQDLLDRGWRRSGTYLYQPGIQGQCCPPYTIRLDATQYQPSATHKRVQRKFELFLSGAWAQKEQLRRQWQHQHVAAASSLAQPSSDGVSASQSATACAMQAAAAERQNGAAAASVVSQDPSGHTSHNNKQLGSEAAATNACAQHCGRILTCAIAQLPADSPAAAVQGATVVFKTMPASKAPASLQRRAGRQHAKRSVQSVAGDGGAGVSADSGALCMMRCSVCWQAAAKQCNASNASAQNAPPLSKSAAKRLRKQQAAQQRRSGSGDGGIAISSSVADTAERLAANHILPLLQSTLAADAAMAAMAPLCIAERGHLWVAVTPCSAALEQLEHTTHNTACDAPCAQTAYAGAQPLLPAGMDPDAGCRVPGERQSSGDQAASGGEQGPRASCATSGTFASMDTAHTASAPCSDPSNGSSGSAGSSDGSWCTESSDDVDAAAMRNGHAAGQAHESGGHAAPEDTEWWLEAPPPGGWPFTMVLAPSVFDEREFRLWQRYQAAVHKSSGKSLRPAHYRSFLVNHPFACQHQQANHSCFAVPARPPAAAGHCSEANNCSKHGNQQGSPATAAERDHHMRFGTGNGSSGGVTHRNDHGCADLAAVGGVPTCGYGAHHLQYYLGKHLVAVSYIDILPRHAPPDSIECTVPIVHKSAVQ